MKRRHFPPAFCFGVIAIALSTVACRFTPQAASTAATAEDASTPQPILPAPTPTILGALSASTDQTPTSTSTPTGNLYIGELRLSPAELPAGDCEQFTPFGLPSSGLTGIAFVPTEVCFNGEITLLNIGERLFAAQSGGPHTAYQLTDVTDATAPEYLGSWRWNVRTFTTDVKSFIQDERTFLVLAMSSDPRRVPRQPCGVAIVEVTEPRAPQVLGQFDGAEVGSEEAWCSIHTTQVNTDADGDGAFILASSDETQDLRVLDIRNLPRVREVNVYAHPSPIVHSNLRESSFVHDTTVVDERLFISYWAGGVMIVDLERLESGAGEDLSLNPPNSILPSDFKVHHSYPTTDGNFLFIEDEITYDPPFSQLRLFDIRDFAAPKEVLAISLDEPKSAPHNLLVWDDLLFVGWYIDGIRVFRYDVSNPESPQVEQVAFHEVRAEGSLSVFSDIFDGIYGVRLHTCEIDGAQRTCVYASDLTLGLLILALDEELASN